MFAFQWLYFYIGSMTFMKILSPLSPDCDPNLLSVFKPGQIAWFTGGIGQLFIIFYLYDAGQKHPFVCLYVLIFFKAHRHITGHKAPKTGPEM